MQGQRHPICPANLILPLITVLILFKVQAEKLISTQLILIPDMLCFTAAEAVMESQAVELIVQSGAVAAAELLEHQPLAGRLSLAVVAALAE